MKDKDKNKTIKNMQNWKMKMMGF